MENLESGSILRVALYARVSTDEQKEGQTIDSQIGELESFCRQQAWQVCGVYKDEGYSGALLVRPALDRLRDDASKGAFSAVLINDVDRLARDVSHLAVIRRDLERRGIRVVFRKLPGNASPTHDLMINILGSFAQFERELMMDRVRRGMRHRVEVKKQVLTSHAPYGYRYVRKNRETGSVGSLEINPEEASVVKQIYSWVEREGLSGHRVVTRLNDLKIVPRKGARSWARTSVMRILRSEVYAGTWHYGKHQGYEAPTRPGALPRYKKSTKSGKRRRPKSEWLPVALPEELHIVSRKTWEAVQKQIDANITFSPRHSSRTYVLGGLIRCGACGATFVGEPCHNKLYYRCAKRCKKVSTVKEDVITDVVWQAVERVLLRPAAISSGLSALRKTRVAQRSGSEDARREMEQAMTQIATEESRLLEAYRLGVISPRHLGDELQKLSARKTSLQARQAELAEPSAVKPSASSSAQDIAEYCRRAAARMKSFTDDERQRFLRLLELKIIFTGTAVHLRGKLPIGSDDRLSAGRTGRTNPPSDDTAHGGWLPNVSQFPTEAQGNRPSTTAIDNTSPECCVRNPSYDDRAVPSVPFEATADVPDSVAVRPVNERGKFCRSDDPTRCGTRQRSYPRKSHVARLKRSPRKTMSSSAS